MYIYIYLCMYACVRAIILNNEKKMNYIDRSIITVT